MRYFDICCDFVTFVWKNNIILFYYEHCVHIIIIIRLIRQYHCFFYKIFQLIAVVFIKSTYQVKILFAFLEYSFILSFFNT